MDETHEKHEKTTPNTRRRCIVRRAATVVGVAVVAMAGGGALGACGSSDSSSVSAAAACGGSAPKLTVQGTGLSTGTPNLLTVSVGVDVTDSTAQAALADDNTTAEAVDTTLEQGGVATKDVQTSDLSIQPRYSITGALTGYEVTDTLTANLRDFATAGSVIDALAQAAGDSIRIDSLAFSVEDTRSLEDQARDDAVHEVVSHAQSMAQAAGERLGPVCSMTDDTQESVYPSQYDASSAVSSGQAARVPLEPGSQEETAQVTMVYALLPPAVRK